MRQRYVIVVILLLIASIYAQNPPTNTEQQIDQSRRSNENYKSNTWNPVIGYSEIDLIPSNFGESSMNNLICDAMLERTETNFSFLNFLEINSNLYQGEITNLDLISVCPFERTLVILKVEGDFLRRLIESRISGIRKGLAIGGGKIEFEPDRPSQNRLTYFQVGEYPIYPLKEYRIVTIDYLADGNMGFDSLATIDSSRVYRTGILLRDAIHDYISDHSPLNASSVRLDERWIKK